MNVVILLRLLFKDSEHHQVNPVFRGRVKSLTETHPTDCGEDCHEAQVFAMLSLDRDDTADRSHSHLPC